MYAIADPIERDVAAVLKAESTRYQEYGRRTGGLGSVQTTYRGQTFPSLGSEWRRADSPENQSIIQDPENARIESDNATALVNVYEGLRSEEERNRFVQALLNRLSRDAEYAPVGYLILLVLFRIGRLSDALQVAVRSLQGDQGTGFSDLLRLLDGLLRYEHQHFSPELMDEIERSIEGIQEHTFRVRERIAAIRAYRLARRN